MTGYRRHIRRAIRGAIIVVGVLELPLLLLIQVYTPAPSSTLALVLVAIGCVAFVVGLMYFVHRETTHERQRRV